MSTAGAKRILWVDDEIDFLKPHLLFLQQRGYHVDAIANGDDALALLGENPYDLVLLDEQMPGRRGLEVLEVLRRRDPHARVVMISKSEEDRTMTEAIGRRVDDYLVKPTSPRQVLSVVTRILEGSSIQQQRVAQDFAARFPQLSRKKAEAADADTFREVYAELVDWHIRLENAGEHGLLESVQGLTEELRRDFGTWTVRQYPAWLRAGRDDRPRLSVDVVADFLVPALGPDPVYFVVLDCMRLDQWRVIAPLLSPWFDVEEHFQFSILPTATPYARNAIFSGLFPDEIARRNPGWWDLSDDEGSLNAFEDRLLAEQLKRLTGREIPVHYEKIFGDRGSEQVRARIRSALGNGGVIALVFNFVDLMTHGRSESPILMEVARDAAALRDLTRSWFERSALFQVLREAAQEGRQVIFTTDHGSLHCMRPATVFARKDATSNLRYKFGSDIRAEDPKAVLMAKNLTDLRLPAGKPGVHCLIALDDHFFVYPTKLREYQARYRGSFLHGGVSPEEMIVPVARLLPRGR
ncbi:MAG: response regulator [Gemmatimonadota bacterium]